MTDEDGFLLSPAELELRIEPRVQARLAAAGVPPDEVERVLEGALCYVRQRAPAPHELERRFLFAVERECRRFEDDLRARIESELGRIPTGTDGREEEP